MTRRFLFVAITAIALLMMVAQTGKAQTYPIANPGTCCSFMVVTSCHFTGTGCIPVTVRTVWSGAAQTDFPAPCGGVWIPIAGCPPAPATLDGITIDGNVIPWGGPTYITLTCGFCARVSTGFDPATGCIRIQISACP